MKKNILYTLFLSLCIALGACSDEVESPFAEGMGELRLTPQMSTNTSIPVITKVPDFSSAVVEDLRIVVTNSADEDVVDQTYTELLNDTDSTSPALPIALPLGTYTVKVCTNVSTSAGVVDVPYFEEIQEAVIEEKKVTNLTMKCTFECIGVELALSEQFKAKLEAEPNNYAYEVTVSNGEAVWTFDKESMEAGYFLAACDELEVRVKVRLGSSNDWYPERVYRITNKGNAPQLGEYYIITLDAGESPEENTETTSLRSTVLTEKN